MTEPAPSGGPSPLRVGGLALLGAGAVAALIGLATLLPGRRQHPPRPPTAPPRPAPHRGAGHATVAARRRATVAAPPAGPARTQRHPPLRRPAPAPVGTADPAPARRPRRPTRTARQAAAAAVAHAPVRVYNNSTITGLAARAAEDFRADGWQVAQVANYPSGVIATSTVYYRPGTAEQSAAYVARVGSSACGWSRASPASTTPPPA